MKIRHLTIIVLSMLLSPAVLSDAYFHSRSLDKIIRSCVGTEEGMSLGNRSKRDFLISQGVAILPRLCQLVEENRADSQLVAEIIYLVIKIDGQNIQSPGYQPALNLVRQILSSSEASQDIATLSARIREGTSTRISISQEMIDRTPVYNLCLQYLAQKGAVYDLQLLEFFSPVGTMCWANYLRSRLAGTNLVEGVGGNVSSIMSTNAPRFVPSVANTGPQAAVAFEHIKAELEKVGGIGAT